MKQKAWMLLSAITLAGGAAADGRAAFDYERHWTQVEQYITDRLPASALNEVEHILNAARAEGDFGQLARAAGYRVGLVADRDDEAAYDAVRQFESLCDSLTLDAPQEAVMRSMLAELYRQLYERESYAIDRRTPVAGPAPDDPRRWTRYDFFDKVTAELWCSLAHPDELARVDAEVYKPLLAGMDIRDALPDPRHTLLDVIGLRAISQWQTLAHAAPQTAPLDDPRLFGPAGDFIALPLDTAHARSREYGIVATHQTVMRPCMERRDTASLVLWNLSRLRAVRSYSVLPEADALYEQALVGMARDYATHPAVVDVLDELAALYEEHYRETYYRGNTPNDWKRRAYDLCAEAATRWPDAPRIAVLQNRMAQIACPKMDLELPQVAVPADSLRMELTATNVRGATLYIYKVDASPTEYHAFERNRDGDDPFPRRRLVHTQQVDVPCDADFNPSTLAFRVPTGECGIYEYALVADGQKRSKGVSGSFTVSRLAYLRRADVPGQPNVIVVDRTTGQPLEGVTVDGYKSSWDKGRYVFEKQFTTRTDAEGGCRIDTGGGSSYLVLTLGDDRWFMADSYTSYYPGGRTADRPELTLLTDRSIYRPGQVVRFKGIAFDRRAQRVLEAGTAFEIRLQDANRREVGRASFRTNEYGSFSGEFVLPVGGVNGVYRLVSDCGSQSFRVEEYKRPSFEVVVDKPQAETHFGQPVAFTGTVRTYAGHRPDNARITYRVTRRPHYWYAWRGLPEEPVASGMLVADAEGRFTGSFTPERGRDGSLLFPEQCYTYAIEVAATDSKGETQQAVQTVNVGDRSLLLSATVADYVDKGQPLPVPVVAETLNGVAVDTEVQYALGLLAPSDGYLENNAEADTARQVVRRVQAGTFRSADGTLTLDLSGAVSGEYRLDLTTTDAQGQAVRHTTAFVLYGADDARPPVNAYAWLPDAEQACAPGETAAVRFGTSAHAVHVLYEVWQAGLPVVRRWVTLDNEIRTFTHPFTEACGDAVDMLFTFVKDGQCFTRRATIDRRVPDKSLALKWTVFRDRLRPGDAAEWTAALSTPDGTAHPAVEVLAGMYDASLDALYPHTWTFAPDYHPAYRYVPEWGDFGLGADYGIWVGEIDWLPVKPLQPWVVAWNGLYGMMPVVQNAVMEEKSLDMAFSGTLEENVVGSATRPTAAPVRALDALAARKGTAAGTSGSAATPALRQNFSETAFFYPHLRADGRGEVSISFTAPESLTRWNVRLLAHTPDLHYGSLEAQAVTQKELMAQLNLPRFVRRGDRVVLAAQVANLTDSALTATVTLQLLDPATEQPLKALRLPAQTIALSARETRAVQWEAEGFSAHDLLVVRLLADAGTFADGEQRYLPVLPDQVRVTATLPLTVRGGEKRTFDFTTLDELFADVRTQSLTVEMTGNPAWQAVLALPTLANPATDNALDLYAAWYANSLAGYVARSNPRIARVFTQWQQAGGDRDTLLSNLEQNEELKNILLQETPWVLDAADETEQRRRIALLFDLNRQADQATQLLARLTALQRADGGFEWFRGMGSSRYVTQTILLGAGRYARLTGDSVAVQPWVRQAIAYADQAIQQDYAAWLKRQKQGEKPVIGNLQWHYLHMRSEFPSVAMDSLTQRAADFYSDLAYTQWKQRSTLYGQAATAVIATRNNRPDVAQAAMASLREYALHDGDLGMYWNNARDAYTWDARPVFLQTALIEAFAECGGATRELDEMKLWLLCQKQTQAWESSIATADAVHALLLQGTDWLVNSPDVTIRLGNRRLPAHAPEAGTGYTKIVLPATDVKRNMARITVNKPGEGVAWGAVYWQYWQDVDKVKADGNSLTMDKQLYVERTADGSRTLVPVSETTVHRGDRIVTRLTITTDRNLEFVALEDLRAAGLEPTETLSGYEWNGGAGYYRTTRDNCTQFFFDYLPKGYYVLEYASWANNAGEFSSGTATLQCLYAPEYAAHSAGGQLVINE